MRLKFKKEKLTFTIEIINNEFSRIKKNLIHRIAVINDLTFLNAIKTILDTKAQSQILILTSEQRSEIIESQKEIEQGLYFEQIELDREFEKWLNAR